MKRKHKQWLASLACLGLMTLGACGGGHNPEDFDEDFQFGDTHVSENQEESGAADSWGQCSEDDWSNCNVFGGEVCISGLCVGPGGGGGSSGGGGGGGECSHSIDCPNVDDICSHGVCM